MKPSELKKDRRDTIRVNSDLKEELKRRGFSIQGIVDDAIDRILTEPMKVTFDKKKK